MATLRLHTPSDAGKTIISHCSDGFTSLKLPLGRRHLKLVGFHERFAEAFFIGCGRHGATRADDPFHHTGRYFPATW